MKRSQQYDIHCEQCGRVQPKQSRWRRQCASCRKRAQGREVTGPARPAGWRPTRQQEAQP